MSIKEQLLKSQADVTVAIGGHCWNTTLSNCLRQCCNSVQVYRLHRQLYKHFLRQIFRRCNVAKIINIG